MSKKISLGDRLSRFYPSLPAGDSITIRHLLTHTSGLYVYNNDFSMPTHTEEAMIRFLAGRPLEFAPGSKWRYCNTGYYLLGFIIEKLTGITYANALKTFIFDPLGMRHSGLDFKSLSASGKATGYRHLYPDSGREASLYAHEELRSSGGVWSTAGDVLKFHNGMQQFKLISDTSTSGAYTPFKNQYGYGWFIDTAMGTTAVSHSGGAAGFRTLLVRIPATNTCIILLANAENIDLAPIKDQILLVLAGRTHHLPRNEEMADEQLAAIAGTYALEPGRFLYVTRIHHRLTAQVSRQQAVLLLAAENYRFNVDGMDGHLEFPPGVGGTHDSVKLYRKNKIYSGAKVNATWGITGSATPNGWDGPDIPLHEVAGQPGKWRCENALLKTGRLKFRFNNDWTFSLGSKSAQDLTEDGNDIPVSAGTFTVVLDLTDSARPEFSLIPATR
ncbi:serine hydrolase [Chitinophaga pollutisoli]|uniref:Serine hydrolase n=1 Tax=Chitinophaga pollutisoli TaxID=3133966 RepID=A0ABZ2YMT6_9BACT